MVDCCFCGCVGGWDCDDAFVLSCGLGFCVVFVFGLFGLVLVLWFVVWDCVMCWSSFVCGVVCFVGVCLVWVVCVC